MPYQMISSLMTADVSRYVVDDLVGHLRCGRTSTILLFESPHTSEVIEGYPLAGEAGARVAKAFLGTDEQRSIGEILSSWRNIPSDSILRHIGIMNVCRLPMQCGPYRWSWRQHEVLHHLSIIREGPEAGRRNEVNTKLVEIDIIQDLKQRTEHIEDRIPGVKFVVCGKVARELARKEVVLCNQPASETGAPTAAQRIEVRGHTLDCVPHPTSRESLWFECISVQNMVEACHERAFG